MKTCTFLFFFLLPVTTPRKLPGNFKKCDLRAANLNQCLTEAVPDAIRKLTKPVPELALPSLHPLVIPAISIEDTSFKQNYHNFKIWGFTDISCSNVTFNYETLEMRLRCSTPRIEIETDYIFNGTFTVLPIYGNGTGRITLEHLDCRHTYTFDEYERRGHKFLTIKNSTFETQPEGASYQFDNLYNGEEILSRNVHLVMNENPREVFQYFKFGFQEAFTVVFRDLCKRVVRRVPIDEIFING